MRDPGKLIKAEKWWNDKAPPVLAIVYFLLAIGENVMSLERSLIAMGAFIVAFIGVAGFGHIINDLFDIDCDREVGKRNSMDGKSPLQTARIVLVFLVLSGLPWLILPANPWNLSLIGLQMLLLIAYAAPPLRLKVRAIPGVITDALYAYTVPLLITWTTWSHMGPIMPRPLLFATLIAWSLCPGLKGILHHQYLDAENDAASGVNTFATRYGRQRTLWVLTRLVIPAEVGCFILVTVGLGHEFWFYPVAVGSVMCWRAFQLAYLWDVPLGLPWRITSERVVTLYGYQFLGNFYAGWFPVLMLVALCYRSPAYLVLAFTHLTLFKTDIVHVIKKELRHIPSGIKKMRHRHV